MCQNLFRQLGLVVCKTIFVPVWLKVNKVLSERGTEPVFDLQLPSGE